jgi:hypothetical protein
MIRHCLLALTLLVGGCANIIQSVELAPGQTPDITNEVDFIVGGSGTCDIILDWGDDRKTVINDAPLASKPHYKHTFIGWRGGKTVTVEPVSPNDCKGMARTRFVTTPAVATLAWARDPKGDTRSCVNFPGRPFLNPNSIVKITAQLTPVVNFGCGNNGCIYDPNGKPGSSAIAPFEFPGLREYSLVLREGGAAGRVFQGGTSAQFTSVTGGELQFCQNNDRPQNNITGGWQVDVRVDELGP